MIQKQEGIHKIQSKKKTLYTKKSKEIKLFARNDCLMESQDIFIYVSSN